jgi:uncharacterized protein YceK
MHTSCPRRPSDRVRHAASRTLRPLGVALVASLFLSGCASIMHGTTQQIGVSSAPTGARVVVNGGQRGVTPLVLDLERKGPHTLSIESDGYEPFQMSLTRSVSGWVWGNIVFGGVIGLAVDAATGGLYKLSPEQVSAELERADVTWSEDRSAVLVRLLRAEDVGAERIGTLERQ